MRVEAFNCAEGFDDRQRFAQRFFVKPNEARSTLKLIHGQPGEGFSRTASRQLVARPGKKIAADDWRQRAEKNRAGGADVRSEFFVVLSRDGQVLGCEVVGNAHRVLERPNENQKRVLLDDFAQVLLTRK